MSTWSDLTERMRTLLQRSREEEEMSDEIAFHLEMEIRKNEQNGLSPAEARRRAELAFGGSEQIKEHVRDARGTRVFEDMWRDVRLSVRTMFKRPEFAAVMIFILAVGIGANATTFTIVDALLLRSLPVPHAERLITLGDPSRTGSMSRGTPQTDLASYPVYRDLRDGAGSVVTGLYASGRADRLDVVIGNASTNASGASTPIHPRARFVSSNYFNVLQVPAFAGRTLDAADDRAPGSDPYVVISYDLWQKQFAGARSAIGSTIRISNAPMTIIGITPPGFTGDIVGQPEELWIPLMMQPIVMPHAPALDDRNTSWLNLMGRLAPGVTLEHARSVFTALHTRSLTTHATGDDVGAVKRNLHDTPLAVANGARGFSYYRSHYTQSLLILMVAVALVMLVVCANVANLMLVRAVGRMREMGIRMAIGAGRRDLIRQMLIESAVLACTGGALGLLLAHWGSTVLLKLAGGSSAIPIDTHLNSHIIVFTGALSLGTAMLFGLAPAMRTTRVDLTSTLRSQGRGVAGAGGGAGRLPIGKLLVVAQVALSMVLLVGTGMLARSLNRLQNNDIGIDRDHLTVATIDAGRSGYKDARLDALLPRVEQTLARVPGVVAVTISENGIFSGTESGTTVQVEGFTARVPDDTIVAFDDVQPGYFHAVGATLLSGRDIEPQDDGTGPGATVINETMAHFYFPQGNPIGRRISIDTAAYSVVGVVRDIEEHGMREKKAARMYIPIEQAPEKPSRLNIEVRTSGDPAHIVEPVRSALRAMDPNLAILSIDPVPSLISDSILQDRLVARVVTFFGALALFLTALGLYGVMAYNTSRRTSEFGLRIALGAMPANVTMMMLREAMFLMLGGVLVGIPAALAATRLLRAQIFGIGMIDVPSLVIAVGVLAISAGIAGGLPALRASRSSPLTALSVE